ncbi:uncharacterized protein KNAG_0I01440 [Huiozyma naganishii CBS 8797]|uniref:Uncharacterized protein n=1 Tax=Huiozyma naganishii (strain ATCC MYA-139 / BCRC 22969 / CBS 8797 / KCTC 17520 / NBRC 10181 / NCYC 3082 / Yp74L-3) TaxID=1071383 RepID=J7RQ80_HUIN7|nr:hypothetical protein KNAG_0I01440 [Kazachstania naganishii CBS 8797]CCK71933.1 hypothetical protein KNAG_0I01440 [Kazachstania naganishii CBS 8797]
MLQSVRDTVYAMFQYRWFELTCVRVYRQKRRLKRRFWDMRQDRKWSRENGDGVHVVVGPHREMTRIAPVVVQDSGTFVQVENFFQILKMEDTTTGGLPRNTKPLFETASFLSVRKLPEITPTDRALEDNDSSYSIGGTVIYRMPLVHVVNETIQDDLMYQCLGLPTRCELWHHLAS